MKKKTLLERVKERTAGFKSDETRAILRKENTVLGEIAEFAMSDEIGWGDRPHEDSPSHDKAPSRQE